MHSSSRTQYGRLESRRNVFLERARESALLTIPTIMPREGFTDASKIRTPYQSIGARGVNNLAAKLQMALFPPNQSFFRLTVDDYTIAEITGGNDEARAAIDEDLATVERSVINELEGEGMRNPLFEALRHLVVTGNYLLYLPAKGSMKGFSLDKFVVSRDPSGALKKVIIKESFSPDTLDPDVLAIAGFDPAASDGSSQVIDIYTCFYKGRKSEKGALRWMTYQEVNEVMIPGTEGDFPLDAPPIMALRWCALTDQPYGRSHVEEISGDLLSLEGLTKAIVDASAASARLLVLVKPNGLTSKDAVAKAPNGAVVTGRADDIEMMQVQKGGDLQVASSTANRIEQRLAQAFLMESAVTRDAERVTAEEIRMLSAMLENALGGVYSVLSNELQLPLVNRLMARMTKDKRLPQFPKGVVQPSIVTGLEALGRGHDLTKYGQLLQMVAQIPEAMAMVNVGDLVKRVGTSLGLDMDGLIKSQEQIQQEQQQMMMAQMAQSALEQGVASGAAQEMAQGQQGE